MLTVPGLCWLCRMPLALSASGSLFRLHAFAGKPHHDLPAVRFTGVQSTVSLRSLPEKATTVERPGGDR